MAILDLSEDTPGTNALRDYIHQTYAKPVRILRDEYTIFVDTDRPNDIDVGSGPCIIIMTRFWPSDARFLPIIAHVFRDYDLRAKFLHSKALIRRSDAEKWYSVSEYGYFRKVDKKVSVNNFTVRHITMLEITDKKTKKRVEVKIEGNAFDAMDRAVRLLYPESHIEEEKEALRRARRTQKGES